MPSKNLADNSQHFWTNLDLWAVVGICLMGWLGRALVSKEPFDMRRCAGEGLLTAIGGVGLYAAGLLQGMTPLEMILFGCLTALGGLRALDWMMKAAVAIRKASNQ